MMKSDPLTAEKEYFINVLRKLFGDYSKEKIQEFRPNFYVHVTLLWRMLEDLKRFSWGEQPFFNNNLL